MHREKVARREIGAFTTAKRVPRSHKIIPPATGKEPKPKYTRSPITYSDLDTQGHGMKVRREFSSSSAITHNTCFTSHSHAIEKKVNGSKKYLSLQVSYYTSTKLYTTVRCNQCSVVVLGND
jgi:hypothetical protein